ncbi:acyl-CoA thioesterase II [soil metagenome]
MTAPLQGLLELLDLERIERDIFRGHNRDIGSGRAFGGQVAAQALIAAARTVEDRSAHSLHGYFILPGDLNLPIIYEVDRIRDGRSFTTRRVVAIQKGRAIFNLSASFQIEEGGVDHQTEMPEVPGPEGLSRELDLIRAEAERIPERVRAVYTQDRPIEFRPLDPVDRFDPERREPQKYVWFRAVERVPDQSLCHQAVLAYASDYGLLPTAFLPHGLTLMQPHLQVASLDHALWFHRPFRVDDWLLYVMDSPSAHGARGFTRGSIFSRDGALVASVAQEGLMRLHEE